MPTPVELYSRDILRFHLGLSRFDESMAERYYQGLRDLEADIVGRLQDLDRLPEIRRIKSTNLRRRARLQTMLEAIEGFQETRATALAEATRVEAAEIFRLAGNQAGMGINRALNASLVHPRLPAALAENLFANETVGGKRLVQLLDDFVGNHGAKLTEVVRSGMLQGRSVPAMTRELYSALDSTVTRRNLMAVVRTATNAVSNGAYHEVFQQSGVVRGVQQVTRLDSGTTEICAGRSFLVWVFPDMTPRGHDKSYNSPPPHHIGCRSYDVPWFYDEKDLSPALRAKIPKRKRIAMGGQLVDSQLDYDKWFRTKSDAFQLDWLGRGRYDLFKRNPNMTMRDLTNRSSGKLTLEELKRKFS